MKTSISVLWKHTKDRLFKPDESQPVARHRLQHAQYTVSANVKKAAIFVACIAVASSMKAYLMHEDQQKKQHHHKTAVIPHEASKETAKKGAFDNFIEVLPELINGKDTVQRPIDNTPQPVKQDTLAL